LYLVQLHQFLRDTPSTMHVHVLSFAPPARMRAWQQAVLLPELGAHAASFNATLLSDPQLAAYRAFGMGRNHVLRVYGPAILAHYALLALRGKSLPKTHDDVLQRGGDVILGADGRVAMLHVGRDQRDRPTLSSLARAYTVAGAMRTPAR
jgi:hypothetical protein